MFDDNVLHSVLKQIDESLDVIEARAENIRTVDDFYSSQQGMMLLDSICMKLIALGESIKNLDKHTDKELLIKYPEIQWKGVMGLRDIIVHHYFDIDAEEIFRIIKEDIPQLQRVIKTMIKEN
jgi:uncharacterized protein with HEPN domain